MIRRVRSPWRCAAGVGVVRPEGPRENSQGRSAAEPPEGVVPRFLQALKGRSHEPTRHDTNVLRRTCIALAPRQGFGVVRRLATGGCAPLRPRPLSFALSGREEMGTFQKKQGHSKAVVGRNQEIGAACAPVWA